MRELLDYGERQMLSFMKLIPSGVYEAQDILEGDGVDSSDIWIRVRVHVKDTDIEIDFSGTDDQCKIDYSATFPLQGYPPCFAVSHSPNLIHLGACISQHIIIRFTNSSIQLLIPLL